MRLLFPPLRYISGIMEHSPGVFPQDEILGILYTTIFLYLIYIYVGFPGGAKELPAKAGYVGDVGLIPESGRSSGGGHGNPLQYSCLENSMDGESW